MALGVGVRVHVDDPLLEIVPAAFLLVVNLFICAYATNRIA